MITYKVPEINNIKIESHELLGYRGNNMHMLEKPFAEKDLDIRGTGDILGYRQSGDSLFKFVNVQDDQEIIIDALEYVKKIISKKIYEDAKFKKNIYKLLVFFKQQEAIKLLFS